MKPSSTSNSNHTFLLILGLGIVLAPLAYIYGRVSTSELITSTSLGVLIGLPFGIYVAMLRTLTQRKSNITHEPAPINTASIQRDLLGEISVELSENKALFEARKGSATLVARLAYITSFWDAAKASGRLFVMQDAHLLSEISLAYYWLDQANHLERLAYDAKNSGLAQDAEFSSAKLISEVRLLDESIEAALTSAMNAIASTR